MQTLFLSPALFLFPSCSAEARDALGGGSFIQPDVALLPRRRPSGNGAATPSEIGRINGAAWRSSGGCSRVNPRVSCFDEQKGIFEEKFRLPFLSLLCFFFFFFLFFFFYFHREIVRNIQRDFRHGEVIAAGNDCFPVCSFLITLFSSTVTCGLIRLLIDTSSLGPRGVSCVRVLYKRALRHRPKTGEAFASIPLEYLKALRGSRLSARADGRLRGYLGREGISTGDT